MADNDGVFDNSELAVWWRQLNQLNEELKYPERYSSSEFAFKQSQKKQLEDVIAKRKDKKNSFAMGKQNVVNTANMNNAMMTQMSGDRE